MFLQVLNIIFFNISNYLPHLELRNRSIQNVVITIFVVISNVGIRRFDCIYAKSDQNTLINTPVIDGKRNANGKTYKQT